MCFFYEETFLTERAFLAAVILFIRAVNIKATQILSKKVLQRKAIVKIATKNIMSTDAETQCLLSTAAFM